MIMITAQDQNSLPKIFDRELKTSCARVLKFVRKDNASETQFYVNRKRMKYCRLQQRRLYFNYQRSTIINFGR